MRSRVEVVAFGVVTLAITCLSLTGCLQIRQDLAGPRGPCGAEPAEHNQTPKEAFQILRDDPEAVGTGIFLVPAPEEGALQWAVQFVPDLTYAESVRRGVHCLGFKFIPGKLMPLPELCESVASGCSGDCNIAQFCQYPCFCWHGMCSAGRGYLRVTRGVCPHLVPPRGGVIDPPR